MLRAWLSCFQMIINKFLPIFYGRVAEEEKKPRHFHLAT